MMQLFKRSQSFLLPSAVSLLLWVPGAAIALILLSALLQLRSKEMRRNVVYQIKSAGTWIGLPLLYLIYVGGMIWSENTEYGFRDLEIGLACFSAYPVATQARRVGFCSLEALFFLVLFRCIFCATVIGLEAVCSYGPNE
jgi:hypothetical protein